MLIEVNKTDVRFSKYGKPVLNSRIFPSYECVDGFALDAGAHPPVTTAAIHCMGEGEGNF